MAAIYEAVSGSRSSKLPLKTRREAHQHQVEFHELQLQEGSYRNPPMPPEQLTIHREQLGIHLSALEMLGGMAVISSLDAETLQSQELIAA